jgi:hypothetical protein
MGFGLVTGFIDHLQMATASSYNALANLCSSCQSVFANRFMVTVNKNVFCLCPSRLTNAS